MGFGGSVAGMIISLKNNARPRLNFKDRFYRYEKSNHIDIKNKSISEEDLTLIKLRIRKRIVARRKRQVLITLIITTIIVGPPLGYLTYSSFSSKVAYNEQYNHYKQVKTIKQQTQSNFITNNLTKGYLAIQEKNYAKAKYYFNQAYIKDDKQYDILIATTKAYLLDCFENNVECELTRYYFNLTHEKFNEAKIKQSLGDLYTQQINIIKEEERITNEKISILINKAYQLLDNKKFGEAENYIYSALRLDENNYNARVAFAKYRILNCLDNHVDCYMAQAAVNSICARYGETNEYILLKKLLESKN